MHLDKTVIKIFIFLIYLAFQMNRIRIYRIKEAFFTNKCHMTCLVTKEFISDSLNNNFFAKANNILQSFFWKKKLRNHEISSKMSGKIQIFQNSLLNREYFHYKKNQRKYVYQTDKILFRQFSNYLFAIKHKLFYAIY